MEEDVIVPPLLQNAEVLLVLLVVLVASLTWAFWELFSFVNRESEDNDDWWEELKNCHHRRLIIPPECVVEVVEPGALSRLTSATSDAVKKMTGVVSSSLQRTGNLITRSTGKQLTKAQKKGSRVDLNSIEKSGSSTALGGGGRRKGSRHHLSNETAGSSSPPSGGATAGMKKTRSRLDLTDELAGETQKPRQQGGRTLSTGSGKENDGRRSSKDISSPLRSPLSQALLDLPPPDTVSAPLLPSVNGVSDPHVVCEGDGRTPSTQPKKSQTQPSKPQAGAAANGVALRKTLLFKPLPDDCTPLLTFVNSRSGVSQGTYLIHQLRRLLNPVQVVDLAVEEPHRALRQFLELPRLRVLVCGGDGTAKWIMNVLEELEVDCWPPIAILPLGTGNDMARVLGWGGGYNNESIVEFLAQVQRAHVVVVDRWEMTVTTGKGRSEKSKVTTFNNYFGIGVDAQAALKFHHLREQKPQLFFSRLVNKMWYGFLGAQDLWKRSCVNLPQSLKVVADGKEVELPPSVQGIMFLNIGSWGGGVKLWHEDEEKEGGMTELSFSNKTPLQSASMQDGLLELVAVNGVVHLGQLQVGLSKAVKICQCSEVVITATRDLPMQVDGEPWGQTKCVIKISRKVDPAYMLKRTMDTGGAVATEMSELLDWAQSTGVVSILQKKSLLTEFSRRVEHRRRTFEQEKQLEGNPVKHYDVGRRLAARDMQSPKDCIVS